MNKKFVAILITALFYFVFAGLSNAAEKAQGRALPTINAHFAASEIRPGETWKVYLKASDPDGDMKYIVASVKQAGIGVSPVSFTRIKEENRKEMSGYVYLNTMVGSNSTSLLFYGLTLTVWIQDRAGNFSNPVELPVTFGSRVEVQAMPASGAYKDQDLGPIMVPLRTMSAEMDAGRFGWIR